MDYQYKAKLNVKSQDFKQRMKYLILWMMHYYSKNKIKNYMDINDTLDEEMKSNDEDSINSKVKIPRSIQLVRIKSY